MNIVMMTLETTYMDQMTYCLCAYIQFVVRQFYDESVFFLMCSSTTFAFLVRILRLSVTASSGE
jgi:hypothetical protein